MAPRNEFEWLILIAFGVSLVSFCWIWWTTRKPRKP